MFGFSFLSPLFLVAAAAVAIPIALHLFRRRIQLVVDFPAVRLLQKAPVEHQRRRRLRELILLALRVSALILLAFAFARPYFASATAVAAAPVTIVVLDTSMSMSAPGQWEAAQRAARRAVETAPTLHQVGLVLFGDSAALAVAPTTDRGGVLGAIATSAPGASGTRFRTALARAAEALGVSNGRIVVITDLQQSGWDASDAGAVPDGIVIEVNEVPPPVGNLAVTAIRRDGQTIVAAVHNYGSRPVRAPVRLRVEGREVATGRADIASQAAAEVRLTASLPPRGGGEVTIDDAEGYQADNSRFFVLDPPPAVPIFVITADPPGSSNAGLYIERALSLADEGRAFGVRVLDGQAFSVVPSAEVSRAGALVLLGTRTLDRAGREAIAGFLRAGGRVLVTLGPDVDLNTLRDTVGATLDIHPDVVTAQKGRTTLVAVDARHPILRPFASASGALGDIAVERYRRVSDAAPANVLLRFAGGDAALTEQMVESGALLIFASDLDNQWNRFPLNPAFVPFALETAKYLTHGREGRQLWTLPDIPRGLSPQTGSPAPGVFTVKEAAANTEHRIAVNVDIKESNPARTTVEEFSAGITRHSRAASAGINAQARDQEERQRLWQIGLVVMLIALAAEGVIGRKAI
jgi:hypothetical protein